MTLRHRLGWLLTMLLFPGMLTAQTGDMLTRILNGMQQAQTKITTECGTVTETRTSKLMTKPMVLHGRFCAEGSDRFLLEYFAPNAMQIRFNENYLNITAGGKTEVMNVSSDVRRVQSSFMGKNSIENLENDFDITAQENNADFELRLVPRSAMMQHKLNYLVVKLNKRDFLPRSVEVDGKSGVNSVFALEITSTNTKIPENTFEVIKTK